LLDGAVGLLGRLPPTPAGCVGTIGKVVWGGEDDCCWTETLPLFGGGTDDFMTLAILILRVPSDFGGGPFNMPPPPLFPPLLTPLPADFANDFGVLTTSFGVLLDFKLPVATDRDGLTGGTFACDRSDRKPPPVSLATDSYACWDFLPNVAVLLAIGA